MLRSTRTAVLMVAAAGLEAGASDALLPADAASPRHAGHGVSHGAMIGVSQGTTGTHSVWHAACRAGFNGVHYNAHCSKRRGAVEIVEAPNSTVHRMMSPMDLMDDGMIASSYRLPGGSGEVLRHWAAFEDAASGKKPARAMTWLDNMRSSMLRTLQSPELDHYHDTPYPEMISLILELQAAHTLNVVAIESPREAHEWAQKRMSFMSGYVFMCRKGVLDAQGGPSRLDLAACLKQCASHNPHASVASCVTLSPNADELAEAFTAHTAFLHKHMQRRLVIPTMFSDYAKQRAHRRAGDVQRKQLIGQFAKAQGFAPRGSAD